jgi:hypothetical protein
VFASADDPDYRALLQTFDPVAARLAAEPRDDLPAKVPTVGKRPEESSNDGKPMLASRVNRKEE